MIESLFLRIYRILQDSFELKSIFRSLSVFISAWKLFMQIETFNMRLDLIGCYSDGS